MADTQTLYKLIILYMLSKVDFPLTNAQISNLILEKEYTSYFVVQKSFAELLESGYVTAKTTHNQTQYRITEKGQETLSFFSDKISDAIKEDIVNYLSENDIALKEEISRFAEYYKTTNNEYAARCLIKDNDATRLELTLAVPNKHMAKAICENWTKKEEDIYEYLLDLLIQ